MRFLIVHDALQPCPYLPGKDARMPLRAPLEKLGRAEFDRLLDEGDRRFGVMLYRTECPDCRACEPIRVSVPNFRATRSQRRVLRRNEGAIRVEVGVPAVSAEHVRLFNRHKSERGLDTQNEPIDEAQYRFHLVDTCVDSREVRYYVGTKLVAVSILDLGLKAASSVYHYFDPDESERSLGVYSVMREIALCAAWGIEWYYLGLYVSDCRHLAYKAQYGPHERRIDGVWTPSPSE